MRSNRFGGVSRMGRVQMAPALLTRISRLPSSWTVCSTASCRAASSRTSTASGTARRPMARMASAVSWMEPGSRSVEVSVLARMAMSAPSAARRRARALPMPRLAPVMRATRPWRSGWRGSLIGRRGLPGGGFGDARINWREFVDAGHAEQAHDPRAGAGETQLAAGFLGLGEAGNQRADGRAVDIVESGGVEDCPLLAFFDQLLNGAFQLIQIAA